jgi:predicted PurR-regulated permease PerM
MGNEPPAANSRDECNQPDKPKETKPLPGSVDINSLSLTGLFVFAFFYTLYFAQVIFLPLVVALLLSFMLAPVVRSLSRLKIPEALGAALLLILLLGACFMDSTVFLNLLQNG